LTKKKLLKRFNEKRGVLIKAVPKPIFSQMGGAMNIPSLAEAHRLLCEAQDRNPGPWVQHSLFVAQAARIIANQISELDPRSSYILGYVHDIGKGMGASELRHTLDGYNLLYEKGYEDAARICITHSFPVKDVFAVVGSWDCSQEEIQFVSNYLNRIEYNLYDRLIQLCDGISQPDGFCVIEQRMVDVALRHGINSYTLERWRAFLGIKSEFEAKIGKSIYSLLPGIVESILGHEPALQPA
jgi:hypothetical protein